MRTWKTIGKQPLCQPNRFLAVELHQVELPDGQRIDDWPWVITPDYVNILARDADGRFLVFSQTKYALNGDSLAVPGGFIEPGEEPLVAAQRELLEETGCTAPEWKALGSYVVDPSRGAGNGHFFLALGAQRVAEPTGGDLEEQKPLRLTRKELEAALAAGEFQALAWTATVALGLLQLPPEPVL